MGNGTAAVLEPTFTGYVATTHDALILFEACLTGVLHHVPRRPHDRERSHLVRSGCVFIYEENSSGIKRWTDGVTWSPSRILGNFLVYRELEKPFPPGEKKRAMKKTTRRPVSSSTISRPGEPYPRPDSNGSASGYSPTSSTASIPFGDRSQQSEMERALVGSLVDSYGFKDSGLVKKTMSVTVGGVTHHLVSYYSVDDVMRGVLTPPSMVESLRYIRPRAELTQKQSFRAPIDDLDTGIDNPDAMYGYRPPQQMMGAPTAPSYTMPNPHPDFYLHPSPYSASHPPGPSGPMSAYSIGQALPPQPQPGPGTYLPAPLPTKTLDDYSQYRPSPHYGHPSAYDSLSQSSSMPSTLNTSLGSSHSDRHRSQSDNSPTAYRNSSISSRSVATDATSPMDPATPGTYSRSSFSLGGALDASGPGPGPGQGPGGIGHSQSLDHRGMTAFDPLGKRDPNPNPFPTAAAPYYAGPDRHHPYYANAIGGTGAGAAAGGVGGVGGPHPGYAGTQSLSSWTTTAPSQPQV